MGIFSRLKRAKPLKTDQFDSIEVVTKTPKTDCEVVTFARLDYWSMLSLFDRIPVHDLVRLNGLASWWSGYVHKVCRTKRDITVRCGEEEDPTEEGDIADNQDQFNILRVTNVDAHTSDRLVRLLQSITSLEIIIDASQRYRIADITYLVSQWSHQLVNLKIKCHYYGARAPTTDQRKTPINELLLLLNTSTTLRRLSINCLSWKWLPIRDSIELTILSQLEYFYFYTGHWDFGNLQYSLVRYAGPNHQLKQIELPSLTWTLPLNDLLDERQFLSKLTMLELDHHNPFTPNQWTLFPSLTTVNLGSISSRSEFMEIITGMLCLKLVRNLGMRLLIDSDFDRDLDQAPIDLPQLSTVTNLALTIRPKWSTNLHSTFKSLKLGTIFPNVESVHVNYYFGSTSSSYRVVKWMAKFCNKLNYRMVKFCMRREFTGVKCTFNKCYFYLC